MKKSKVRGWIKRETPHKRKALENASKHFDEDDSFSVYILEGMYGQESSYGTLRGKRNSIGPAGDFQIEKKTAIRLGLTVNKNNDQRFDVDDASAAAAKYLKINDDIFNKETDLGGKLETIAVASSTERTKFVIAAYNAGEGRIAKAQTLAKQAGKDPSKWDSVKEFLIAAGATKAKNKEVQEYVENVIAFSKEFEELSKANKRAKDQNPDALDGFPKGGHWITKDGRHILIRGK